MAALNFTTIPFELKTANYTYSHFLGGRGGAIRPCSSNIAYPRFEVYKTFLCVFMSNFMVFMRYELCVNVPVAIVLGTVDCSSHQAQRDIWCYTDFDANNNNRAYCFTKRKKYLTVLSIEDDNRK